jgi:hypothetical protein
MNEHFVSRLLQQGLNTDSIKKKSDSIVVFLIHLLANHNIFYKDNEVKDNLLSHFNILLFIDNAKNL